MVRKWVVGQWKLKGSVSTSAMLGSIFLFRFMVVEDLSMVLVGSWLYGKHPLTTAKWKPGFNLANDLLHMVLVWIRLEGLH